MPRPEFVSSLSTRGDSEEAIREVAEGLAAGFGEGEPDLLLCFASIHHGDALATLGPRLQAATGARELAGCTGDRILANQREIEEGPALAAWAVRSNDTQFDVFDITASQSSQGTLEFNRFPEVDPQKNPFLVLLADAFSFPMGAYLPLLERYAPGLPAIGGMASGGQGAGQNLLFRDSGCQHDGAVGVLIQGDLELTTVVSQGCRPVGRPYVVTSSEGNVLRKLGGKPAARILHQALSEMEPSDQELFRHGPFLGLALDPRKSEFERSDFLVRGIMGHRREDDSLVIADPTLRVGMTVQFLVRDAASASEDLTLLMEQRAHKTGDVGALIFSCNGRGRHMFEQPNHDISCVQGAFPEPIPAAGFFALGEIGPVGNQNFLHGFTASIALVHGASNENE